MIIDRIRTNRILPILVVLLSDTAVSFGQSSTMNYIQSKTFLDAGGSSFLRHIDYYDELGNVVETVDVGGNATRTPVAVRMEYNTRMKVENRWAPVPITDLEYHVNVSDEADAAYNNWLAYSMYEYDEFLNLTGSWKPGEAWDDHPVTVTRDVVPAGAVRKYTVGADGSLCDGGTYPYGSLTSTIRFNERKASNCFNALVSRSKVSCMPSP